LLWRDSTIAVLETCLALKYAVEVEGEAHWITAIRELAAFNAEGHIPMFLHNQLIQLHL